MTLIKSVLNSIPIFFFSFFRVSKNVMDKLVGLQRQLLWGRKLRPKEDCLGELGYSLSAKGEKGLGYKGFGEV